MAKRYLLVEVDVNEPSNRYDWDSYSSMRTSFRRARNGSAKVSQVLEIGPDYVSVVTEAGQLAAVTKKV